MKKQFNETSNHHSKVEVDLDIENPMLITILLAIQLSKRLFSILLHIKLSVFLVFMIMFTSVRLFKSQRMKRKVLSLLMALSLVILMIVGRIIQSRRLVSYSDRATTSTNIFSLAQYPEKSEINAYNAANLKRQFNLIS